MSITETKLETLLSRITNSHRVKDAERTRQKLSKILKEGPDNLHVICDFDATMTRLFTANQTRNPGSHDILHSASPDYKFKAEELYKHYRPIETDSKLTIPEKVPYMVEWWEKAGQLLIDQKFTKDDIAEIASKSPVEMRESLEEVISRCKDNSIPFLVFSAGIANVIEELLRFKNLLHSNMHIVSNQMEFDPETGLCNRFKEPLLHVFNKSEVVITTTPYFHTIKERGNVILLGDSIGDLHMSSGIDHDVCLTIGFLNNKVDDLLKEYMDAYDILVLNDGSMEVMTWILKSIDQE